MFKKKTQNKTKNILSQSDQQFPPNVPIISLIFHNSVKCINAPIQQYYSHSVNVIECNRSAYRKIIYSSSQQNERLTLQQRISEQIIVTSCVSYIYLPVADMKNLFSNGTTKYTTWWNCFIKLSILEDFILFPGMK